MTNQTIDGVPRAPVAEVKAEATGVLTFMRDEKTHAGCVCCPDGDHVFCRYFKGLPDFYDLTKNLLFRNDLEGREFKVTVELLPSGQSGDPSP